MGGKGRLQNNIYTTTTKISVYYVSGFMLGPGNIKIRQTTSQSAKILYSTGKARVT